MSSSDFPQHVLRNRDVWTGYASEYADWAPRAWAQEAITWGIWHVPETELRVLPELEGKDVVELGCGTAYVSAWLARRGARPVGIDVTPAQLETARRMQADHGLEFPLIEASAEAVPLPDESFDLAVSEYGASLWADPYRWIPEAARLLRPEGHLVFLTNGTLVILCSPDEELPAEERLLRPYFGMHRFEWEGTEGSVEFHLGYGDWIRLLRANGFEVLNLLEIRAPEDAEPHRYPGLPTKEWARKWPSEHIWVARKASTGWRRIEADRGSPGRPSDAHSGIGARSNDDRTSSKRG
jgi:SAM-dependent methyltransferase